MLQLAQRDTGVFFPALEDSGHGPELAVVFLVVRSEVGRMLGVGVLGGSAQHGAARQTSLFVFLHQTSLFSALAWRGGRGTPGAARQRLGCGFGDLWHGPGGLQGWARGGGRLLTPWHQRPWGRIPCLVRGGTKGDLGSGGSAVTAGLRGCPSDAAPQNEPSEPWRSGDTSPTGSLSTGSPSMGSPSRCPHPGVPIHGG